MSRTFVLATVFGVALALPAMAAGTTVNAQETTTDATAVARGNLFTEEQARFHLAKLGYVNVSPLTKDSNGAWAGTAMRDGKQIIVAVDIKGVINK